MKMTTIELLRKEIEQDVLDYNQLMSVLSGYSKPRELEIWSKDFFRAAIKRIIFE
jgi:hypothetical protein